MNHEALAQIALENAVRAVGGPATDIVKAAAVFYDFLVERAGGREPTKKAA